jgi:hypothetical protein
MSIGRLGVKREEVEGHARLACYVSYAVLGCV